MNDQTPEQLLREFIKTFEASLDPRLWMTLIEEELTELEEASQFEPWENILKEAADLAYVSAGLAVVLDGDGEHIEDLLSDDELENWANVNRRLSAAIDYLKDNFSPNVLPEAFKRVHQSNMSKLGDDGKPIRREDGKIMKGPNYKAPDLSDLV